MLENLDRLLGPAMFFLAVAALILAAGVLHRLSQGSLTPFEREVLFWGLAICWPLFVMEALVRLAISHRPETALGRRLGGFVVMCVFPPLRLGARAYADADCLWLPGLGWTRVDHHLRSRLERFFSAPMVAIALLVLPFLAMEYFWLETVRADFLLSLVLDIGTSVIWLAFALELIVMASVADSKTDYCLHHWMDVAVVCLPLVDFLPILRLFRLTGLLEFQQVSRLGRLYRLRSLLAKIWRAMLLMEMVHRLFGNYREKRLARLKKLLRDREDEIIEIRQQIATLEMTTTQDNASAV
jgi:voltage-gated potassium channel